jgi:predicted lipid-binding transport protein (Tim44 family)
MAGFCSLYAFAYYALAAGAAADAVASVILPGLFFGLMVSGLVVGLIALGSKQKRKGYAIAAIVISLLTMLAAVASLL